MKEYNEILSEYGHLVEIVVRKYNEQYRDDLRQDLLMFLYNGFKAHLFENIDNLINYIFVCLKNEASKRYNRLYKSKINTTSLDKKIGTNGIALIDTIPYQDVKATSYSTDQILINDLKSEICKICTEEEYLLIYRVFVDNVSQHTIAAEFGISQQAVSKRLKKILTKLKMKLITKRADL